MTGQLGVRKYLWAFLTLYSIPVTGEGLSFRYFQIKISIILVADYVTSAFNFLASVKEANRLSIEPV